MAVDHCHGPHGEQCVKNGLLPAAQPEDCGDPAGDNNADTEQHVAVQRAADALRPVTAGEAFSAAPLLLAILPEFGFEWRALLAAQPAEVLAGFGPDFCRPPPSVESARTVVLLI